MANLRVSRFDPSGDSTISAQAPALAFGTSTNLIVRLSASIFTLVKWDISTIPSTATIQQATFTMTSLTTDAATVEVFRLVRAWVEVEVTWNIAKTATNWGTAGANNTSTDYNNAVLATAVFAGNIGQAETIDITQTVSDWHDGTNTNHGLKIAATVNEAQFYSKENSLSALAPRLTVFYTMPLIDYQLNSNNIDCGIQAHWAPIVTGKNANATQKTSVNWRRHTWTMAFCEMVDWEILEPTRGTSFTELKTTGHSIPNTVNTYSTGRVMGVTGRQVGRRMENVKVDYLVDITS